MCACVSVCVRARAPLRATRSVAAPATSVLHGFVAAARGPAAGLACAGGSEVCHGAGAARLSHLARRVGGTGDAPTPEGPRAPGSPARGDHLPPETACRATRGGGRGGGARLSLGPSRKGSPLSVTGDR